MLIDPLGLQAIPGDDTYTARAKALAAQGDREGLKRFLQQYGDYIDPKKARRLTRQCNKAFQRKAKKAAEARRRNPDFNDFTHRDYKPDVSTPGGGQDTPDLSDQDLVDAAEEFFGPDFWK